jgi:hypothetical protein
MAEIPLPFTRFFGQNMAQVLFFVLNLAGPGKGITLGGAFLCFHLGHSSYLNTIYGIFHENSGDTGGTGILFFGFGT